MSDVTAEAYTYASEAWSGQALDLSVEIGNVHGQANAPGRLRLDP